jgi:two-component system phosphate regulon sensor histidine kinase PhoR
MPRTVLRVLAGGAASVAAATAVGAIFGHPALGAALALATLLVLNLRNLVRVDQWLRNRDTESPPDLVGLWGEVVAAASRIHRRKLFHEHRVNLLLREFRRMAEAIPDGVVLLGPNREIQWFNAAAGRWLGLRRRLDRGMRIDNLVRHPDVIAYLESRGALEPPRVHMARQEDRWLAFFLAINEASGQQLLVVRDVTREARLDAMRQDFVANASHELRSPLTVIGGYLDAMADDESLDAAWREPVGEMRRQSDRMRGIVQDLLELSRLEAQTVPAELEPVDVAGMLASLRRDVAARTEPVPTVEVTADSDARLLGSEPELHSVFSNLVTNAVKYTPPEGRVCVRWWVDGQGGHVAVSDTGIGIPAEHLPRLTERFYRVDAGRSRKLGGSGLGLAIVKHALQRHGARLEVQSVEGRGSTFTCHFPPDRVLPA